MAVFLFVWHLWRQLTAVLTFLVAGVLGHCWYMHIVLTFVIWTCIFPEHLWTLHELVSLFLGFHCPILVQCMVMLGISILSFSVHNDSNASLASHGFESPLAIPMIIEFHFLILTTLSWSWLTSGGSCVSCSLSLVSSCWICSACSFIF